MNATTLISTITTQAPSNVTQSVEDCCHGRGHLPSLAIFCVILLVVEIILLFIFLKIKKKYFTPSEAEAEKKEEAEFASHDCHDQPDASRPSPQDSSSSAGAAPENATNSTTNQAEAPVKPSSDLKDSTNLGTLKSGLSANREETKSENAIEIITDSSPPGSLDV